MPDVKLNAADAAELGEMLQFLAQWLARDPRPPCNLPGTVHRPSRLRPGPVARRPGALCLPARRQPGPGPLRRHGGRM